MLVRTNYGIGESVSCDGGRTWSDLTPSAIPHVNSRFFIRRLKSGRMLLVKNGSPAERLAQRSHMSAWLSADEGRTWTGGLLLDERSAVSYPDGFESPDGSWDRAYLHSTAGVFVVLDDQLVFPYCAFSGLAPSGNRGMYAGASVGLATLCRDVFASLDVGDEPGTLTTRPVSFTGEFLFVNLAAAQGSLTVEVLDDQSRPIPGFAAADCLPISEDSTREPVRWRNGDRLGRLAGTPVRFRFQLTRGDLYAFWVSRARQGQSGGYVAAGGPAFTGIRDE